MGKYDRYFYTEKDGITGPILHPEIKEKTIKVDKGKLGEFGISWEPIMHPFTMIDHSHKHDYGQILAFVSNNLKDLFDFDAEIEFHLGGEKHIITESTIVYIPGGTLHCPLIIRRVGKPFLFNNMYFTAEYMARTED
ncbi:MAG TPA: hypothetical protein VJ377_00145 [Dehalococcoidales bacterium]|nr:hypothetical protein [Dehalococcoidales bacterium]